MNLLDRAISFVSPEAGVRRGLAREQLRLFGYDAALPGVKRGRSGSAQKNASSENWRSARDRIALMWDARDVTRNFAILRGMVARITQYVCDGTSYISQTGDDQVDAAYQNYFNSWARSADLTGRHNFGDLVTMAFWAMLVDGDHGWNILTLPDSRGVQRIQLQAIESDRIGNPYNPAETNQGNKIGGIEVDEQGRPLIYSIYKRSRLTVQYTHEQDIPAAQFIHLFDPQRVDQYRGVTALATAIAPARDLYEIYEFEKQAAKWQVGHAGVIKVADPFKNNSVSQWDDRKSETGTGPGTMEMVPGKILRLTQGEDVTFSPGTNRPNGAFLNLVQTMIREMSMGMNMPYGFLYDMSTFGGHASRIEIAQAQRCIRRYQRLLKEQALDPVRDAVLSLGIALGDIPSHPSWQNGRWGFGSSLSGDYGNDTAANMQKLQMGLVTASDLISETGQTFEEVVRRQATEVQYMQRVASETGVPIELMSQRLAGATDQLAAMNTPPQPPSSLMETGTDVKPLLDILKNVGEGIMDRQSAITSIVSLYGLNPAEVDKMVPEQGKKEEPSVKTEEE
jgi:lambda family phage portal protein